MKELLRRWARRGGWTIHRWPANRFEGMHDALGLLRRQGYDPKTIVDIGANIGTWTDLACSVFDAREHHIVEPQQACHAALARFRPPRFAVHHLALTSAGVDSVLLVGGGPGGGCSGAFVTARDVAEPGVRYPATSLDRLLADRIVPADRALLKLDVEGSELAVLGAGARVLDAAEVVVAECQLYQVEHNDRPVLADAIAFMTQRDFCLYDVAALHSRARDRRLRMGDVVFVHRRSPLVADNRWG